MIFTLNGGDRVDFVCPSDGVGTDFTQAEVANFPFLNQVRHRSGDIFDRYGTVDAVLMVKIDIRRSSTAGAIPRRRL